MSVLQRGEMMNTTRYWMVATVVESAVIGLFAGIAAYNTYWCGTPGIFLGLLTWGFSFCMLLIRRDEEDRQRYEDEHFRKQKSARPSGINRTVA